MEIADRYTRARIEASLAKLGVQTFKGETVTARIDHDRWVADCPCNGAELVAPGESMLCGSCGAEHTVKFPDHKTREKIEGLLTARPSVHRNWWPEETVDELLAQNIENGIWEGS